ncbi:hypothetical protein AX284_08305 [Pseudomonas sp. HUK17]|nr:hypothetical protein AX284_08305 [Pseudomonas sp. HUK17]
MRKTHNVPAQREIRAHGVLQRWARFGQVLSEKWRQVPAAARAVERMPGGIVKADTQCVLPLTLHERLND